MTKWREWGRSSVRPKEITILSPDTVRPGKRYESRPTTVKGRYAGLDNLPSFPLLVPVESEDDE